MSPKVGLFIFAGIGLACTLSLASYLVGVGTPRNTLAVLGFTVFIFTAVVGPIANYITRDSAPSVEAVQSHYITTVDSGNFAYEVENSYLPVLVEFCTNWDPNCRRMEPDLEQFANEYRGRAKFVKVNVDLSRDLATRFQAQQVPAILIFDRGRVVDRADGYLPTSRLRDLCRRNL